MRGRGKVGCKQSMEVNMLSWEGDDDFLEEGCCGGAPYLTAITSRIDGRLLKVSH